MSKNLTTEEFDQLRQHLIVPLAVSDILTHDLDVQPDMHYGLHLALSEVDPDSALLAIAICAGDIATKANHLSPIAAAISKESMDILGDYAPNWMHKNINTPMPSHVYEEILETVPEDLEGLADLMDALYADIHNDNHEIATLLKLLSIQARAHMEIADFVLAELVYERNKDGKEDVGFIYAGRNMNEKNTTAKENLGDNIIVFPGA